MRTIQECAKNERLTALENLGFFAKSGGTIWIRRRWVLQEPIERDY